MPETATSPVCELSGSFRRPMGKAHMGESVCCQWFSKSRKDMLSMPM